jgi:hypothetical protein
MMTKQDYQSRATRLRQVLDSWSEPTVRQVLTVLIAGFENAAAEAADDMDGALVN